MVSFEEDVQNTLNYFNTAINQAENKFDIIMSTLSRLQGAKFGINHSSPGLIFFNAQCSEYLEKNFLRNPQNTYWVLKGLWACSLENSSVWQTVLEQVKSGIEGGRLSGEYLLRYFHVLNEFYRTQQAEELTEASLEKIRSWTQVSLRAPRDPNAAFEGVSTLLSFGALDGDTMLLFSEFVRSKKDYILQKFDQNQTALAAQCLHALVTDSEDAQEEKQILDKMLDFFVLKDLAQYDTTLQNYEFHVKKSEEIGVVDSLNWSSIGKILRVLTDEQFYQLELEKRIEDCIFRKSETDIIDLRSGCEILECALLIKNFDYACAMRVIDMLNLKLEHDSESATYQFFFSPALEMLRILTRLTGTSFDGPQVNTLQLRILKTMENLKLYLTEDDKLELKIVYQDNVKLDPKYLEKLIK